ncbi:MAG: hypothetical protein AB1403_22895 [Candidatus Riflebacteria bacterium]
MELRELKIEISEELLETLKKASETQNTSESKLAGQIIEKALKEKAQSSSPAMPGVALIKEGFNPEPVAESRTFQAQSAISFNPTSAASGEKLQRRQALEARMKEVSMLIDTAENESRREEYVQMYAQLAAELDAIL